MEDYKLETIMHKLDRVIVAIDLLNRDQVNPSVVNDVKEMADASWKRIERSQEQSEAFTKWLKLSSEIRILEEDYPNFKQFKETK